MGTTALTALLAATAILAGSAALATPAGPPPPAAPLTAALAVGDGSAASPPGPGLMLPHRSPAPSIGDRVLGVATAASRSIWIPLSLVLALMLYLVSRRQLDGGPKLSAPGRARQPDDEIIEL